jgi:RNA polymerase sigma factor (sigma-70 family)
MTAQGAKTSSWGAGGQFAATRWSIVLAAGGAEAGTGRRKALEELARAYWVPLYAYIRRQGGTHEQAEDLTQEYFSRLLEKDYLASVDRSKGKFRSFLLASLKHFLANERDRTRARKRGGGLAHIALDSLSAAARYALEPADEMTPERLFDRQWALAVLEEVLGRLREQYRREGKADLFEGLKGCLTAGADQPPHAEIARKLGLSPGAVKVAAHRLRRRYRELLRDEIAQTVASPQDVQEEIAYLLNCL